MDCAQKARCAKNIGSIGGAANNFFYVAFFELEPKTAHCSKINILFLIKVTTLNSPQIKLHLAIWISINKCCKNKTICHS